MRKQLFRVGVIGALILVPAGIWWFKLDVVQPLFRKMTDYPDRITIAAGSEGGRYRVISESLGDEIRKTLAVDVEFLDTQGSLENLLCLRAGTAHIALYQPGTIDVVREYHSDLVQDAERVAGGCYRHLRMGHERSGHLFVKTGWHLPHGGLSYRFSDRWPAGGATFTFEDIDVRTFDDAPEPFFYDGLTILTAAGSVYPNGCKSADIGGRHSLETPITQALRETADTVYGSDLIP